ncbi:hypothetical protein [Chondrinema litorale]|uniref:hypothetical protein n=1 Tax=Chondrinema litorale TaxID=2994555 RepID=UPI00254374D8|nr:hypothetical protein [Chondrinema litorale]UZR96695.1 hypothetical protein OQ292_21350 [Chondrinema litorale]
MNYFSHLSLLKYDYLLYFEYLSNDDMLLEFGCIHIYPSREFSNLWDLFWNDIPIKKKQKNIRLLYRKQSHQFYCGNFLRAVSYKEQRLLERTISKIELDYLTSYQRVKKHAISLKGISDRRNVKHFETPYNVRLKFTD